MKKLILKDTKGGHVEIIVPDKGDTINKLDIMLEGELVVVDPDSNKLELESKLHKVTPIRLTFKGLPQRILLSLQVDGASTSVY